MFNSMKNLKKAIKIGRCYNTKVIFLKKAIIKE